jgi:exodeoxyribonuclease VII large subunit
MMVLRMKQEAKREHISSMSDLTEIGGATPQTNTPEISVSELANALKQTIEDRFGYEAGWRRATIPKMS